MLTRPPVLIAAAVATVLVVVVTVVVSTTQATSISSLTNVKNYDLDQDPSVIASINACESKIMNSSESDPFQFARKCLGPYEGAQFTFHKKFAVGHTVQAESAFATNTPLMLAIDAPSLPDGVISIGAFCQDQPTCHTLAQAGNLKIRLTVMSHEVQGTTVPAFVIESADPA